MNSINFSFLAMAGEEVTKKILGHTYLEFIVVALFVFCFIFGLVRGFVRQVLGFIGFAGSIAIGAIFFDDLGAAAHAQWPFPVENPWLSQCIWFAIAFFALLFVSRIVIAILLRVARGLKDRPIGGGLDRFFGLLLSLFVLYACVSLLIGVVDIMPDGDFKNILYDQVFNGRFLHYASGEVNWLGNLIFSQLIP